MAKHVVLTGKGQSVYVQRMQRGEPTTASIRSASLLYFRNSNSVKGGSGCSSARLIVVDGAILLQLNTLRLGEYAVQCSQLGLVVTADLFT